MKKLVILTLLLSANSIAWAHMMNGSMGMKSTEDNQKTSSTPAQPDTKTTTNKQSGYSETQAYCSQCHKAPIPSQHTAEEWPKVVERMQGYMQKKMMHLPVSTEIKSILEYLDNSKTSHAKK